MIARLVCGALGAGGLASAFAVLSPSAADLEAPGQWLLRPAALPFAWRDLERATRNGDAGEVFAVAKRILRLLPGWTDGQAVFAYRFATRPVTAETDARTRGEAAWRRLQIALAWLEGVLPQSPTRAREVELLEAMAMLPEVALAQEPALAEHLPPGGTPAMADRWLARAEELADGPYVREQRTFRTVELAAAFLAQGDRDTARAILEFGIRRSADLRDRELATEWARRLDSVVRHLDGEEVDLDTVLADKRMSPLAPYLSPNARRR